MKRKLINTLFLSLFSLAASAQSYSGNFLNYKYDSLLIRKLTDSASNKGSLFFRSDYDKPEVKGHKKFSILPFDMKIVLGNTFLNSLNDENFIPGNGVQSLFTSGLKLNYKYFDFQFAPRFLILNNFGQNQSSFPVQYSDRIWRWYYNEINRLDRPFDLMSNRVNLFWGDSYFTFKSRSLRVGLSTATKWIGPGYFNSLIMTNSAPGMPHFFLKSNEPIKFPFFNVEFDFFSGLMRNSNFFFPTKNVDDLTAINQNTYSEYDRYANGFSVTIQPRRLKNLYLGFSRMFYLNRSSIKSLKEYFPVFLSGRDPLSASTILDGKDQMASIMFKLILPSNRFEIYAEIGRNDFAAHTRDFVLNPDHTLAYLIGMSNVFSIRKEKVTVFKLEYTRLQGSFSYSIFSRGQEGWYRHNQVTRGYTNFGQVVGAGIGTGSQSLNAEVVFNRNNKVRSRLGGSFVINNNDFLYNAFRNSSDKKPWSAYNTYFVLNRDINSELTASFRIGLLYENNIFWYHQAKEENISLADLGLSKRYVPYINIFLAHKL